MKVLYISDSWLHETGMSNCVGGNRLQTWKIVWSFRQQQQQQQQQQQPPPKKKKSSSAQLHPTVSLIQNMHGHIMEACHVIPRLRCFGPLAVLLERRRECSECCHTILQQPSSQRRRWAIAKTSRLLKCQFGKVNKSSQFKYMYIYICHISFHFNFEP